MKEDPIRVGDLLRPVTQSLGMEETLDTSVLYRRWREIVGETVAAHCKPVAVTRGVLKIRADSPAWGTEFGYLAAEIQKRANELAGADVVGEVKVVTGGRTEPLRPGRRQAQDRDDPDDGTPREGHGRLEIAKEPPSDPREAFERAHAAWERRRRRSIGRRGASGKNRR